MSSLDRRALRVVVLLLLAVSAGVGLDVYLSSLPAPVRVDGRDVAEKAIATIKPQPWWDHVSVDEANGDDITLTVHYRRAPPAGIASAAEDTKAAVRAVLAELMKRGWHPSPNLSLITVRAEQDGLRGETGTPLVRGYGRASYNIGTDQIEFKAK